MLLLCVRISQIMSYFGLDHSSAAILTQSMRFRCVYSTAYSQARDLRAAYTIGNLQLAGTHLGPYCVGDSTNVTTCVRKDQYRRLSLSVLQRGLNARRTQSYKEIHEDGLLRPECMHDGSKQQGMLLWTPHNPTESQSQRHHLRAAGVPPFSAGSAARGADVVAQRAELALPAHRLRILGLDLR